ncbi:nuclear transport factor 2 family protein [Cerasicoccus fimbriatus]|uniref:nuclear transport factor 2 family protein n=1 Tax=Cerasicoccus fimbriatus TaxID=3014554 RepID=UPI0022B51F55|nr:nuclear transport factor 2 family protein [Cerasicoccus sp. TK19100]
MIDPFGIKRAKILGQCDATPNNARFNGAKSAGKCNAGQRFAQVWTEGDTALVSFEHFFKYYVRPDKSRWQIHIRTTMPLRREGDGWKIIQEHSSPIQDIPRATRIPSATGS